MDDRLKEKLTEWFMPCVSMDSLERHMAEDKADNWCWQGHGMWERLSISEDTATWLQRHAPAVAVFEQWYDERSHDAPCVGALFYVLQAMQRTLMRLATTTSFRATDSYAHYQLLSTAVAECWKQDGERERFMERAHERHDIWETLLLEQIRRPHECETPRGATTLERLMMECHRFEPGAGTAMWIVANDVHVSPFVRTHWPDWYRRLEQAHAVVDLLHENVEFNQKVRLVLDAMAANVRSPVAHTVPTYTFSPTVGA